MRIGNLQRIEAACELGESPLWDHRAGCLWWIDSMSCEILRMDWATREVVRFPAPSLVGAIALCGERDLILACQTGLFRFSVENGARFLFPVENDRPAHRLNEGKVDPAGNFWIGAFGMLGMPADGALYRVRGAGRIDVIFDDLRGPNALVFLSPERFILADSPTGKTWVCDIDPSGRGRRLSLFLDEAGAGHIPDGAALSRDGLFWNAKFGGGTVVAHDAQGAEVVRIALPVTQVTSCCFAGPDLDVLAITTARRRLDPAARRAQPEAGDLFLLPVSARGIVEPVTMLGA